MNQRKVERDAADSRFTKLTKRTKPSVLFCSKVPSQIGEALDHQQLPLPRPDLLPLQRPGMGVRNEHRVQPALERRIDVRLGTIPDHPPPRTVEPPLGDQ